MAPMISNLEKYKRDLDSLIQRGKSLKNALAYAEQPGFEGHARKQLGEKAEAFLKSLPDFNESYQAWYSEAKALIRQLLPDRLEDFARLYEKPKSRREITFENYTIEDCLHGLVVNKISGIQRSKCWALSRPCHA